MIRRAPLPCLLVFAGIASAADAPAPELGVSQETSFTSAAIGGRFTALPPSEYGFPVEILGQMRIRLGGEPPAPEPVVEQTPEPEPSDGH